MIYISVVIFVWIYLYMWNIAINSFKFNNRNKLQTIILTILFIPIELSVLCVIFSLGAILGLFSIISFLIKNSFFNRLFKGYLSVIKDSIKNYLDCIKVFDILNNTDKNTNYYNVANANLLVNYFVSIIRCQVSVETFECIMNDFIIKFNNGMTVLKWIEQNDFLSKE